MTLRLLPTTFLASAVTFLLFWIMTTLVAVPYVFVEPVEFPTIAWVEVRKETPELPPAPEPVVYEPVEPVPHQPAPPLIDSKQAVVFGPIAPEDAAHHEPGPLGVAPSDGDAIPLVRVPPRYPERALARGLEGRVLVEFTIDASGGVRDARVLVAEPAGIFEEAALRAVAQWRYNPKIVNGRPVVRSGERIAIPFLLD